MQKCILTSVRYTCFVLFLFGNTTPITAHTVPRFLTALVDLQPDLVVETSTLPLTAIAGFPFPLSVVVLNQGDDWANASSLEYFLSTDTEWSPDDLPLGADAVRVLPPLARESKTRTLTPPKWVPTGPHFILFRCDAGNTVPESDENNVFSYRIELKQEVLPKADLSVGAISVPALVRVGDPFTVQAVIRNTGDTTSAFCNWTLRFSKDATLSSDDQTLAVLFIPPLSPGQSTLVEASVQVGMDHPFSGTHSFFVIADSANKIAESNENNNTGAQTLELRGFPPPADCRVNLGPGELLCAQPNGNNGLVVRKKAQNTIETFLLDADGQLLSAPDVRALVFDSILVQNKRIVRKLANGTVVFQRDIPTSLLSRFPTIEAAALLPNGGFALAGFQKYYDPQGIAIQNRDSLVLIRTDAGLNYNFHVKIAANTAKIDQDKVHALSATADGGVTLLYTLLVDRLVPTPFLTVTKYNPAFQALHSELLDGRILQSLTQTPCNNWLLKSSYQTASAKGYDSGNQLSWLDIENAHVQQRFVAGFGSLSQFGAYRDYFVETRGQDSLFAGFSLLREGTAFDSVGFSYSKQGQGIVQRKIPFMAFQQVVPLSNNRYSLLGPEDGNLWVYAAGCKHNTGKADLELSVRAEPPNPALWQYGALTLTLKNNGAADARDIRVDFMNQSDPAVWSRLAYVNASPAPGTTYNNWYGQWAIPLLAPGENVVLRYTLFTKVAEDIPIFAQVASAATPDLDSSPGNNLDRTKALEDDEAFLLLQVAQKSNQSRSAAQEDQEEVSPNQALQVEAHPNPASTTLQLRVAGGRSETGKLRLMDALGKTFWEQSCALGGAQTFQLDVQHYAAGLYTLLLVGDNGECAIEKISIGRR